MGTGFDLLLIAVILLTVTVNYFRGIFKMLKSFKFMAAVWIALEYKASATVRAIIGHFMDFGSFRSFLRERLDAMWGESLKSEAPPSSGDGMFSGIADLITNVTDYYNQAISGGAHDVAESVLDNAAAAAEGFFVQLIGFIIVFIFAFIVLTVISVILTAILNHGILKHINRILGGIAGLAFGFIFAWIITLLIVNVLPMISSVTAEGALSGFFGVVKWFYNSFAFSRLFGITPIM